MLSDVETDRRDRKKEEQQAAPTAPCPQCGFPMVAVRGNKDAICRNCGFKDSCCY
jgi:ribosomal protein L37AE/L43A